MSPSQPLSQTKAAIIDRFEKNALLQAPILATVRRSALDMSVDQPSMSPAADILASSLGALERGETHYVDVFGIAPLREQLALWLRQMGLADCTPARTMAVATVQEARFLTLQKLGELLGPIGLPSVVYPGVRLALGVRSRALVEIAVEASSSTLLPELVAIENALQEGAKLLYLESPSRLTGAAYDAAALQTLAALLKRYDAAAIWEQGLAPWVQGYSSLAALPGMGERVVVIGEAWPGLGLESWPVSYISGQATWLEPIRIQKQIMSICTSTASQYAALAAAYQYPVVHEEQMQQLAKARHAATAQAQQMGVELLMGDALTIVALRKNDFVVRQLKGAGYTWTDGAVFGAPGVMRLAIPLEGYPM